MTQPPETSGRWYAAVTRYQWTVLAIASLGWVFDVFEGQIFVASMNEALPSLLPADARQRVELYNRFALAAFLLGGACGGVLFGVLSDRIGRVKTMTLTILVYSLFTALTAFVDDWRQMVVLRFVVALGVGGEWAVASTLVAEVFPRRARAWVGSIFHASSVVGVYLAVAVGMFIVANERLGWRWGFAVGALPALLTLWIRWRLKEPEAWVASRSRTVADSVKQRRGGRVGELFSRQLILRTMVGVVLAATGMATFWGVHIYGRNVLKRSAERQWDERAAGLRAEVVSPPFQDGTESDNDAGAETAAPAPPGTKVESSAKTRALKNAEMLGMLLAATGGGLGLFLFGWFANRLGRRWAFGLFHIGGLVAALLLFNVFYDASPITVSVALIVFGFLTVGMHAGYAIYFPELFPTRLRGTGAGFCFNIGRVFAAPILILGGWLQSEGGLTLPQTTSLLSLLYIVGLVTLFVAPETRGVELEESGSAE